jgi:hypothetical protein
MRVIPKHIRKGLLRLYLVLTVIWVAAFGYIAYHANANSEQFAHRAWEWNQKADQAAKDPAEASFERRFGGEGFYGQTAAEMSGWSEKESERRDFAFYMLPLLPVGLPVLYLVVVWITAGFRKPQT